MLIKNDVNGGEHTVLIISILII